MSYVKTKGIVIKEVNTGEADKIVNIFSKGFGRISGSAKGARRPKSKLIAGTQLLCYSDFVLFKGKEIYSINSCDVIEPFYEIRNDVVKLTYTAHMIDLISDIIQENQPSVRVLQLLLNALHMLSKTDKSPELVNRIFELRLLTILGYAPYVRGCTICGNEDACISSFSFKKCGFVCCTCLSEDRYSTEMMPGTVKAIYHIICSHNKELFNFDLSDDVLSELGRISQRYLRERLEREYRKLDFLKEL